MQAINKIHKTRADWMSGKYGLMVHYILPRLWGRDGTHFQSAEETVKRFDIGVFMDDFLETGAEWLIFTIGQNTGFYCSPNETLDRLAGPGHCTKRDLLRELAVAVKHAGKRFIAYLPCEVSGNKSLHDALGWDVTPGAKQEVFQERYSAVIREWSERLGNYIDGWWLDGYFGAPGMPEFPKESYLEDIWLDALRAGNPSAVVTFNDGCFCCGLTEPTFSRCDYLAGEAETLIDGRIRLGRDDKVRTHLPDKAVVNEYGCLWHVLLPIDAFWALGGTPGEYLPKEHRYLPVKDENNPGLIPAPIFPDEELGGMLRHCLAVGGAVTLNVGIYLDGGLSRESIEQIRRISEPVCAGFSIG